MFQFVQFVEYRFPIVGSTFMNGVAGIYPNDAGTVSHFLYSADNAYCTFAEHEYISNLYTFHLCTQFMLCTNIGMVADGYNHPACVISFSVRLLQDTLP